MAERDVSGIRVAEQNGADQSIPRAATGVTAFVGRTLKGPVNRPIVVASFADFRQVFGGLWQPATLSYALEQYFENGGRQAVVVRVVNGARPPTLGLPGPAGELRLVGLNPGSREYLRASVDYDGIGENEPDRFNLVLQRLRSAGSELIEDQEIFRRLSIEPASGRLVADVLLDSRLARVTGRVPERRPARTLNAAGSPIVGYVGSNPDGDDGGALTDYDIIGSAVHGTGLFALKSGPRFDFLCIPPLTREQDVGLSALLVAGRLCREQHALLVVDPPAAWDSAQAALAALRAWPLHSENAVMYFPRIVAFDRLRGRMETFAPCGAAAGMLARADETCPVWGAAEGEDPALRPGSRPAFAVSDIERVRLAQAGVNVLQTVRSGTARGPSPRTLAAANCGASSWRYLAARRLALFVMASIESGTRWLLFAPSTASTWQRACRQVEVFLESLRAEGAFAGGRPDESYFVICDERLNGPESVAAGRTSLLFGFAIARPGEFHTCLVTHEPGASRVRPVSTNRLATGATERLVEGKGLRLKA